MAYYSHVVDCSCVYEEFKKIWNTEALEKLKTKRKVSATDRNAYSW